MLDLPGNLLLVFWFSLGSKLFVRVQVEFLELFVRVQVKFFGVARCYIVEFTGSSLETEKNKLEAKGWPPHHVTIFLETERKKPKDCISLATFFYYLTIDACPFHS